MALLLFAALILISCGKSGYTGTWNLLTIEADGESLSASDTGQKMTIEIKDSGKAVITSSGTTGEADWTEDKTRITLKYNGESLELLKKDSDTLTAEQEGITMTFKRGK